MFRRPYTQCRSMILTLTEWPRLRRIWSLQRDRSVERVTPCREGDRSDRNRALRRIELGQLKRSDRLGWIRDVREVRRVARLPLSSGPVLSAYRKETWSGVGEPREALTFHAQLETLAVCRRYGCRLKKYYIEDLEDDHRLFVEAVSDLALDRAAYGAVLSNLRRMGSTSGWFG